MVVPAAGAGVQQIAQWLLTGAYSIGALTAACGPAAVMAALALIVLGGVGTGSTSGSQFYTPEERIRRAWLDMYYWTHNPDGTVKQHIGPAPTPFTKYLNEGLDAEGVDELVKERTRKGRSSKVRESDTPEDLAKLGKDLIEGGERSDEWEDYDGDVYKLEDGTLIGLRNGSRSGGPTIDIRFPNAKQMKVHLPKGWGK